MDTGLTGTSALIGSNPRLLIMCGAMEIIPCPASNSVAPSGVAVATARVPMVPPAPGRFSTIAAMPSFAPSSRAISLAVWSIALPGGMGAMILRIFWLGVCAMTGAAARQAASAKVTSTLRRKEVAIIV